LIAVLSSIYMKYIYCIYWYTYFVPLSHIFTTQKSEICWSSQVIRHLEPIKIYIQVPNHLIAVLLSIYMKHIYCIYWFTYFVSLPHIFMTQKLEICWSSQVIRHLEPIKNHLITRKHQQISDFWVVNMWVADTKICKSVYTIYTFHTNTQQNS
jgi:hypothetical protein